MSADKKLTIIYPEDKLPLKSTFISGLQHVVAMFGATVLGPLLMGFNPNVAILFSGIATLIFYVAVRGKIPSYLGSSFSFIAAVIAATGYVGPGPNPHIALALGGIIAAGVIYTLIGFGVTFVGYKWLERLMPPVLTGAIVAIIGLNLAPVAVHEISTSSFTKFFGFLTILFVATSAVFLRGFCARLPILIGGGAAYIAYLLACNCAGLGTPIDFGALAQAPWFGLPAFTMPVYDLNALFLIAPVAVILVAENLGHVRAIGAMTGRDLDPFLGRAFMGDGIATIISATFGGTGVTTYAENMGVMAITKNFSGRTFIAAALFAICFGLSPKFGAAVQTIPGAILGGLSFVVFGLITATAGRIWVENKIDFTDPKNLIVVGTAVVMGAGDLTITFGSFALGGIAVATFSALLLYHILNIRNLTK